MVPARSLSEGLKAIDASTLDAAFLDLRLGADTSLPLAERLADLGVAVRVPDRISRRCDPGGVQGPPRLCNKPFTPESLLEALFAILRKS